MFQNNLAHSGVYSAAGVPKLKGVKWTFHTNGEVVSSPAIVDGVIYVGSNDGNLYALDQQTGTKKWVFQNRSAYLLIAGCRPRSRLLRIATMAIFTP